MCWTETHQKHFIVRRRSAPRFLRKKAVLPRRAWRKLLDTTGIYQRESHNNTKLSVTKVCNFFVFSKVERTSSFEQGAGSDHSASIRHLNTTPNASKPIRSSKQSSEHPTPTHPSEELLKYPMSTNLAHSCDQNFSIRALYVHWL